MTQTNTDEELKKKSASSVRLLAVPLSVTYLLKFAQTPVLAIFLSPADFGIWGLANVLITGMESLTEVGIQKLLIQRDSIKESFLKSVWGFMILRGFFITAVALTIVPYYASYVNSPEGKFIFTLAILVPAIQGFITPSLYLYEREIEFKNIAIYEAIGQILFFGIVVLLAFIYRSVLALVVALILVEGVKVFMSYYFFGVPAWPRFPRWHYFKEIIDHGKHFFLISLGTFITIQLDNLMVGKLLGNEILGYYIIAYTLINVVVTVIRKLFGRVLFPYYTKLVAGGKEARNKINRILEDQFLLLCVFFTLMFVFAPPFIRLFFDDRWTEAIPIIQLLSFAGFIRGLGNLIVPMFLAEKKQNILAYSRIIEVVTFVPAIYFFTTEYGVIGTAFGVSVIYSVALIFRIIMAYRLFSLEVFRSAVMVYAGTFAGIISLAFLTLVYMREYLYVIEYFVAPVFLVAILIHFIKNGKTISYFLNKYIRHA